MALEKIQLIKLDQIDRPVKISREIIDPEKIRELAESIRESGLLQPVLLRPSNGRFEMVAGDRRYLAHKLLNLKEIKAIVREFDDRETVVIRGIENLQRVDLTASEEAQVYLVLKDEGGLTLKEIAKKTGKAVSTIARYINFARLPLEVRRVVDEGKVSMGAIEVLHEIDDMVAFMFYFNNGGVNGFTEKVARLWVDDYLKTKQGTYYSEDGGGPVPSIETEPKPTFITCESCHSPCEIHKIRNVAVCPDCVKKVRHT
jgi:ParB/RepB/Spo0J family partition protein